MPNFKPKANKKIKVNKKSTITLDSKHQEKIKEFTDIKEKKIPDLKKKLKKQKKKLKEISKNNKGGIEEKLNLKDDIEDIKKTILNLEQEEKKYYLNNSKYIFEYFESKKVLSEGSKKNKNKNILNNFFSKNKKKQVKTTNHSDTNVQKYLINIDNTFMDINNYIVEYNICPKDNCNGEMIHIDYMGMVVCNKCAHQQRFLADHEKPSYKEPPKEVCFYAYKRINHFREILAQFQAKETTQIPQEVIDNIKAQIIKERITFDSITNERAKDILKKLGYNKYYEHIPFIKDKLGIKPPIMSPELEDTLCNLFMEIQKPYAKHCPEDRVNFLNYYYVLYKLCELLNQNTFLPFFPMLKDPCKRIEQDNIWKKICKELNWEFIPTI
tara:strand:- start:2571 stop:3719 length:1149 start_codon:yes stop_codon:yes gene_type:complete